MKELSVNINSNIIMCQYHCREIFKLFNMIFSDEEHINFLIEGITESYSYKMDRKGRRKQKTARRKQKEQYIAEAEERAEKKKAEKVENIILRSS